VSTDRVHRFWSNASIAASSWGPTIDGERKCL